MLVIVESPSKCKIIAEYLGPEYKCIATNGHFRTISDLQSINFDKMKVKYSIIEKQRKKQIKCLMNLPSPKNEKQGPRRAKNT